MELGLEGKRVLVSGSSRGIGLAIAEGFLAEGARVALTSRHDLDLRKVRGRLAGKFPGRDIQAWRCDFTRPRDIEQLSRNVARSWQGLDILVANVGNGISVPAPIPDRERFAASMDLNFRAAVDAARVFYPRLVKSRGNLLFISSIAGIEAFGAPVDYATAKAALMAFAKNLARKAARDGVRVNCVAPGNIFFPGGRWQEIARKDPRRVRRMLAETVPMGRFGRPEDIASATLFLCSPRTDFITGSVLVVDGGQTASLF
jgi:3-oxoacyl-[acyl-carrier protein] reductase